MGSDGRPLDWPFEGVPISFVELARRAGGDYPPGAMLRELKRAAAVEEFANGKLRAVKRYFVPAERFDPFAVQRYGLCLHDLASTLEKNFHREERAPSLFEYRVWNDNVIPRAVPRFNVLAEEHGKKYLEMLDEWLSAHEAKTAKQSRSSARVGVGIYFFEND